VIGIPAARPGNNPLNPRKRHFALVNP
jgi:hypothetical protein